MRIEIHCVDEVIGEEIEAPSTLIGKNTHAVERAGGKIGAAIHGIPIIVAAEAGVLAPEA